MGRRLILGKLLGLAVVGESQLLTNVIMLVK